MQANDAKQVSGTRNIWASSETSELPDLVRSLFALALLRGREDRPSYFCSPWISDFPIFENSFGEFGALFPDLGDQKAIYFSDFLIQLQAVNEVRVVTTRSETSRAFLSNSRFLRSHRIEYRFADDLLHEKGILSPLFYLEGSMNITYMGVRVRQEKVVLHVPNNHEGRKAIAGAFIEFDRRWSHLDATK